MMNWIQHKCCPAVTGRVRGHRCVQMMKWGFKGAVLTDFASGQSQMDIKQMVYAGGDMWLDTITPDKWYDKADDLDVYQLQESAKHILYTVANSNAMNGMGEEAEVETHMATWKKVLIGADIAIAVLLILWGIFAILKNRKQIYFNKTE